MGPESGAAAGGVFAGACAQRGGMGEARIKAETRTAGIGWGISGGRLRVWVSADDKGLSGKNGRRLGKEGSRLHATEEELASCGVAVRWKRRRGASAAWPDARCAREEKASGHFGRDDRGGLQNLETAGEGVPA